MQQDVLQVLEVEKSYDGVRALRNANFSLRPGEVHALMGENGAGKSTLSKIIAGSVRADRGRFFVAGLPARIDGPAAAQQLGISMIYQELDLFPNLTLAENLAIGNRQWGHGSWVNFAALEGFARPFLEQVGLRCRPDTLLGSLNIGEMQLVAIARALSMRARILIMDEPTSSLFDDSVDRLFRLIEELKRNEVAIVYVSHKMDEIFRICDRATVMRDGSTIGTRVVAETSPSELIGMMVGREWRAAERRPAASGASVMLEFLGVSTDKLRDVSFELRVGEVLGVAGLVGAGRSELGLALMGMDRVKDGQIRLRGNAVLPKSVQQAFALGIRLLPEDRKLDGLMMHMSILDNCTLADLPALSSYGLVSSQREKAAASPLFRDLSLRAGSWSPPVQTLSGGNQQKVLLARCLLADPDILFLDDPTRGIDVAAKEDIYAMIGRLAARGKGVIFVSSELPELLRCSDRILVMREGSIAAQFDAAQATQEQVMTFATNPVVRPEVQA